MYSVIIVDYNSVKETMEYIDRCIESIDEQKELRFIVVDNSLRSQTLQIIKENENRISLEKEGEWKELKLFCTQYKRHQVHFLVTGRNLGYAKGNNLGIAYSRERWNDKYILVTNNDIFFPEKLSLNCFSDIIKKNEDIAVVGPRILGSNDVPQSPYKKQGVWHMLFWSYFLILLSKFFPIKLKNKALDYDNQSKRCYWVSGCFFLADTEKLKIVGDFDDNTFLYAEEMILSERLLRKGFTSYFYNDFTVVHLGSNTINKYFKNLEAEETIFNSYLYYFLKYRNVSVCLIGIAKVYLKIIKSIFSLAQLFNHIFKIR